MLITNLFSFSHNVFQKFPPQACYNLELFDKGIDISVLSNCFKVSDPEDRTFNHVISDISIVLREATLTISDSIETVSAVESEIMRVVSLSTTEITLFNK